jgi:hypothetical protein
VKFVDSVVLLDANERMTVDGESDEQYGVKKNQIVVSAVIYIIAKRKVRCKKQK